MIECIILGNPGILARVTQYLLGKPNRYCVTLASIPGLPMV